ncbi:MAG: phosphatidylserine/phosphatidylglycerophosphate/cardiolipin synthase family protein [Armatimonadetes bacterium]|nr:phosphatidylserine/phosphatidylglycerophosphate/cardiolipin synthase family protein [Armatimonadota bacterium]
MEATGALGGILHQDKGVDFSSRPLKTPAPGIHPPSSSLNPLDEVTDHDQVILVQSKEKEAAKILGLEGDSDPLSAIKEKLEKAQAKETLTGNEVAQLRGAKGLLDNLRQQLARTHQYSPEIHDVLLDINATLSKAGAAYKPNKSMLWQGIEGTRREPIRTEGNRVEFMRDAEVVRRELSLIDEAIHDSSIPKDQRELDVQMYHLTHPEMIHALRDAAKAGWRVNVLLDPGSDKEETEGSEALKARLTEGLDKDMQVGFYTRAGLVDEDGLMHRKYVRIGEKAVVGGMNLGTGSPENLDSAFLIEGPALKVLHEQFLDDATRHTRDTAKAAATKDKLPGNTPLDLSRIQTPKGEVAGTQGVTLAFSDDNDREQIPALVAQVLGDAHEYVQVEALSLTGPMVEALVYKKEQDPGTKIQVLLNPRADEVVGPALELANHGIEVKFANLDVTHPEGIPYWEKARGVKLHMKGMQTENTVVSGSANFTIGGFYRNSEIMVAADAPPGSALAAASGEAFARDWGKAFELREDRGYHVAILNSKHSIQYEIPNLKSSVLQELAQKARQGVHVTLKVPPAEYQDAETLVRQAGPEGVPNLDISFEPVQRVRILSDGVEITKTGPTTPQADSALEDLQVEGDRMTAKQKTLENEIFSRIQNLISQKQGILTSNPGARNGETRIREHAARLASLYNMRVLHSNAAQQELIAAETDALSKTTTELYGADIQASLKESLKSLVPRR